MKRILIYTLLVLVLANLSSGGYPVIGSSTGYDNDTHAAGDGIYLYNDSTTMYFNESRMNATITDVVGGNYWKNDGSSTATNDWDIGENDFAAARVYDNGSYPTTDTQLINNLYHKRYVDGRGEQLVTNGVGNMGDNTNFQDFIWNGADAASAPASFTECGNYSPGHGASSNDEFIYVDTSKTYEMSLYAKTNDSALGARSYIGTAMYDADDNSITAKNHMRQLGTDTYLTQDLSIGDTQICVNDASNFYNGSATWYKQQVIIWGYENSFGFNYGNYTYSRYTTDGTIGYHIGYWTGGSVGNTTPNCIDLTTPWEYNNTKRGDGKWLSGRAISGASSGATYKYVVINNEELTFDWTKYSGYMAGLDTTGTNAPGKFPPGTAKIKWLFLNNYGNFGYCVQVSNIDMRERTAYFDENQVYQIDNNTDVDGDMNVSGNLYVAITGFFDYLGSAINRTTKIWTSSLDVDGDINATGNITSSNVFVKQSIFAHTNETMLVTDNHTWTNISFGQEDTDLKRGISHDMVIDNHLFIINEDGEYNLHYDADIEDTSGVSTDIDVAGRFAFSNGTEVVGCVHEVGIVKKGVEVDLTYICKAILHVGDEIMFQFIAEDPDVQVSTHGTFGEHPESASVLIEKTANI